MNIEDDKFPCGSEITRLGASEAMSLRLVMAGVASTTLSGPTSGLKSPGRPKFESTAIGESGLEIFSVDLDLRPGSSYGLMLIFVLDITTASYIYLQENHET